MIHKHKVIHYLLCLRNVQSCDKPINGGGVFPIRRPSTFTLLDRWKVDLHHFFGTFSNPPFSKQNIINGSPEQRINHGRRQSDLMINMDSNSNQKFSLPKVQSSSFFIIYLFSLNQYFLMIQKLVSILIQSKKAFCRLQKNCSTKIDARVVTLP